MKKVYTASILCILFFAASVLGDTPPPGTVKAKIEDTAGNPLNSTAGALNVFGPFWQATQPVSGTLTCNAGSGTLAVSGPLTDTQLRASAVPVSVSSIGLPTGASTSALQTTGNASLSSIDSKLTSPIAITGSITATNSANGNTGSAVPAQATQVGGSDGTNLRALKVSSTGVVSIDGSAVTQPVSASSLPLPTGASTSALQSTINTTLGSPFQSGGSIGNSAFGISGTLPAYASTPTFNLGTLNGAATAANQSTANTSLSSIDSKLTSPLAVTGTFFQATQPVSVSSLPLPAGASTSALQTTGNSSLSSIDAKASNIVPSTASTCTLTNSGDNGCTIATGGASTLVIAPSGSWAGIVGVQCSADSSFYELAPVFDYGTRTAQVFISTNDNASANIGGCQSVRLHAYSGLSGTGSFAVNANAGLGVLNVSSSGPSQFYTTSNIRDNANNGLTSTLISGKQSLDVNVANSSAIPISASSLPLPTGAATSALQSTINTTLGSPMQNSGGSVTANAGSGNFTVVQPTGSNLHVAVDSAPTTAVTGPLTDTQLRASAVPVSGTFFQATQPVSGSVTANAGSGTFAVSAASLPLPAGASTAAKQPALGTAGTASADVLTVQGIASMTALKVDGSAVTQPVSGTFFQATQPVSGTVTANAGSGNFTVAQATGTNLHTVVDSGSVTATGSGNFTVVQPTGTNLHTVVDSAPTTAVTQSGTWTVQPGNTANTTAWKVDGSAVTQPVSIATAPVLVAGSAVIGKVGIDQTTPGTTNAVTLTGTGNQGAIRVGVLPTNSIETVDPQSIFDDTFATSSVLDTTNRWNAGVAAGGGVAAAVPVGGGNVTLGTGTTANGYSYLQTQATFPQLAPAFIIAYHAINIAFPAPTNTYLFWGMGTVPATPTATAAMTDGLGFELATTGKMFAVSWSGGSRNVIQDLSASTGNNTQPADSSVHKYFVFYRGDLAYWCIDTESNIVGTMLTGAPGPINNTLPMTLLAIAGASPPLSNVTLNDNAVFVGDTSNASGSLSDGTYKWRKATVSSTGSLSVTDPEITQSQGTVAAGTAATKSTLVGQVYSSTVPVLTNGQQVAAQSDINGNHLVISPDLFFTGQAAQTATVNNIIPATAGAAATDALGYHSGTVQIIAPAGTYTTGAIIFEGSNDNVNFQTIPVYSQLILTGTPITAAITLVTTTNLVYTFPIQTRYIRVRISTGITGASAQIQAFTKLSPLAWSPGITQVAQATAGNLNMTVGSGTVTTVSTVTSMTSGNLALPGIIADIASAALTTTTTTGTITPTFGTAYTVDIPVTVVSGTTPTLDVEIQESDDTATNWYAVYDFPRITATGIYHSPPLPLTGNRIRYVQTVAGTTPSFTRSLNRLQISTSVPFYRQIIDRTIAPITTNSVTPTLSCDGATSQQMIVNQGAGGSAVTFAIDGSSDSTNWVNSIATVAGVVGGSTPVAASAAGVTYKFIRGRVVTGVASTTIGDLLLSCTQAPKNPGIQAISPVAGATDSQTTGTVSTVITLTAPANAQGFILQNLGTSTANVRFAMGATASTSLGMQLVPGQDSGFVPTSANVSLVAESGTQNYNVQWVAK